MKIDESETSTDASGHLEKALKVTYEAFSRGDFASAEAEAERALQIRYDDPELISVLKCAVFWKDRNVRLVEILDPEDRGDFLFKEHQGFVQRFLQRLEVQPEIGLFAIRQFVYNEAARCYVEALKDGRKATVDLTVKAAKAWKLAGAYDRSIELLEGVLNVQKDEASALAELADCWEMVGEIKKARLLFREAFYINPSRIDLEGLRSTQIAQILQVIRQEGFPASVWAEWIPVYGVIHGVFNVRRDLKPLELGQLKQSIFAFKNEIQENTSRQGVLLPRLINRYFWLIDHFLSVKEERSKIEEVLLNIKLLDERIFTLYTH
ncbi:MAG: tetratricopeptide repeat protein [Spirochaetales bacterium]|nr:tetratricopeptide repeat protein [Spirochaetales bacterium]